MNILEQLLKTHSLKEIEEYCNMPKRTLRKDRGVPSKYEHLMMDMLKGVIPISPLKPDTIKIEEVYTWKWITANAGVLLDKDGIRIKPSNNDTFKRV